MILDSGILSPSSLSNSELISFNSEMVAWRSSLHSSYASDEQADIFAEFIAMINYLDNNGITIEPNMIYNRHKYRLSYFFEYAPLKTVVKSVLAPLFESIKNGEFENDDLTRIEYEDTLKQFNVPIIQH